MSFITISWVWSECVEYNNIYNFQQRISWLSHRWRTQRNAISNVNCRIQWIIESLNASCAPWYSEEHACLSVIKFCQNMHLSVFWIVGVSCWLYEPALLKDISFGGEVPSHFCLSIGVIDELTYLRQEKQTAGDALWSLCSLIDILSDKFGLKSGRTTRWT